MTGSIGIYEAVEKIMKTIDIFPVPVYLDGKFCSLCFLGGLDGRLKTI